MSTHRLVVCKDVLGLETNSDYVGWSFGHPTVSASSDELERCKLVLRFREDPLDDFPDLDDYEKYHYWRARQGEGDIYYQRIFVGASQLRLLGRGLLGPRPELAVNSAYLNYIRFRFNNLHSPGYHLTDLACALLLRQGLAPVHCSAFRIGAATVLVIAPPDSGKTLTTMKAVFDHDAEFLSEDLAITDGTNLFACPWTSTFRYYDELAMGWYSKAWMRLAKTIPVFELLKPPGKPKFIDDYIPKTRICDAAPVTHIAFLARRPGGLHDLEPAEADRLFRNLNRYEFVYMKNPMLTAFSYFNPEFDNQALVAREQELLGQLVQKARCMLVQSVDPTKFAAMIVDSLASSG